MYSNRVMIKNIFLLDADKFFAHSFIQKLNQRGSFNLKHFQSYEDAKEVMNQINPDLILIEQKLRGKSGLEVIPLLKSNNPDIDIVMVSDQKDISVVEAAYDSGVVKYFRKDVLLLDHIEGLIKERLSSEASGWRRLFAN